MDLLEIKKDDMIDAVKVLEMVPLRPGVPSSNFVKMRQLNGKLELALSSTVTGIVRLPVKGMMEKSNPVFIDRRIFSPFILTGDKWRGDFKCGEEEGRWKLRQGSRKAELAFRESPVTGYGVWRKDYGQLEEMRLSKELREMLIASNTCSTSEPSLPQFNCVYISGRLVMSTNKTAVFLGRTGKENNLRIPFPIGVIPLLSDGLVKAVGIEGNIVILDCGCGFIEGTVSAVAQKSFPKAEVVGQLEKGKAWPLMCKIPAEKLSRVLTRLSNYIAGIKREDLALRLEVGEGKVRVSLKVQHGKFEETMEAERATKEAVLLLPFELVRPVLEYMSARSETLEVRFWEERKTPYVISAADVDLLVARKE